jgi:hypothetical protein
MRETLFTLAAGEATDDAFVTFWADLYRDDREALYDNNISVKPFTETVIEELFVWKNGGKLSERKKKSVEENYSSNKEHEGVKAAIGFSEIGVRDVQEFAKKFLTNDFVRGGAIWRIYWLHCCNQSFPIYDQHVHRAMVYIERAQIEELANCSDERQIELYHTQYIGFHQRLAGDQRKIDKALNIFGWFLT